MDASGIETDDPELSAFEMSEHQLGECQCACDHVVYSPTAYTTFLQLTVPANIDVLSVQTCEDFRNTSNLILNLKHTRVSYESYDFTGNVSLTEDMDENVKISITGFNSEGNTQTNFMKERAFCKTLDKYIYERTDILDSQRLKSVCPISKGIYEISQAASRFSVFDMPVAMLGHPILRIKFQKNEKTLGCVELNLETSEKKVVYVPVYV